MAHIQQAEFCRLVKREFPEYFSNKLVLDIGSLDINGNNQFLFEDCLYLGVDLAPGKNVDFVSKGHELALPDASFDVVVSTECFEHDQFYDRTLKNIVRLLKPGGLFFFSCATTGRPEHGTRRTTPHDAPLIQGFDEWSDYYKNLEEADVRAVLDIEAIFSKHAFSTNSDTKDLYFWGIKKGNLIHRNDYSIHVVRPTLRQTISELEDKISELRITLHGQETSIQVLNANLSLKNEDLLKKNELIVKLERRLLEAEESLRNRESEITRIQHSLSWQLTIPVRVAGRLIRGEFGLVREALRTRFGRSASKEE